MASTDALVHGSSWRSPSRRSSSMVAGGYLAPALGVYTLFILWPLALLLWISLHQWDGFGPQTWVGAGNFGSLFSDPTFRVTLAHRALWDIGGAIVPSVGGFGLALLVRQSRARSVPLALLFIPVLLPATVVAALWVMVYSPESGLLNTLLRSGGMTFLADDWLGDPRLAPIALFAAWAWSILGVATLLFWSALGSIDAEYYLLARSEGAGPWWRMLHVTLPGISRMGGVVLLVNAALATQVFDLVFVTTGGGPGYATLLLSLDSYARAFGGFTGQGAAVACIQVGMGMTLAAIAVHLLRSDLAFGVTVPELPGRGRRIWRWKALLGIVGVVLLTPLGWLLLAALEPGRSFVLAGSRQLFDFRSWTGQNLAAAWNTGMDGALLTSAALASAVVAATIVLSVPAAYALAVLLRSSTVRTAILVSLVVGLLQPLPILIIPLFDLLRDLSLSNNAWGIILPEIAGALPLSVLLLYSAFRGHPVELTQAAQVDGATPFQSLFRVSLPLARPTLYASAVWAFITSWNQYLLPTVVSQDGSLQTVPTVLATFLGRYNTAYGPLTAGTALAVVPVTLLLVIQATVVTRYRSTVQTAS